MSLELNARQRAMLQEMGVTVWLPVADAPLVDEMPFNAIKKSAAQATNTPARAEKQQANLVNQRTGDVPPLASLPAGLDRMDWAALKQAAASCQACHLATGRKNSVFGGLPSPHASSDVIHQVDWFIVGDPPTESDEAQGAPFTGESGQLLGNMLKAMGLNGGSGQTNQVVLTSATKCRTEGQSTGPHELAQCEAYLRRQVALARPKMILAMGRYAAQALLAPSVPDLHTLPLGKLRGTVHRYQGIPVVVTYSPAALLRNSPDKAKAWLDLCLAKDALQTTA